MEKYRVPSDAKTLKPPAFKQALHKEVTEPLRKKLTNDEISNMIHYLVRETPGEVSFEKLYEALNLDDREPPLKQEGVEGLREYRAKIKDKMEDAQVPQVIQHLHFWMKANQHTVASLFQLQARQL